MGFVNKISSVLALMILSCGSVVQAYDGLSTETKKDIEATKPNFNWKEFTSKESGFSVDLPKIPDHVHQKIDVPKTDLSIEYDTYVSEPSANIVYVISVWHYPAEVDMSRPEVNLQDGFQGMVSALPGSQVMNMQLGDTQGFKSLEFLVKNEDIFFQGKLILVYNTLYQVFTVYKEGVDMTNNYVHFMNSFKILNPAQNKVTKEKETVPASKMNV